MAFQDSLKISRQKLEFYYSIAIMVIIPLLIVLLTVLLIIPTRQGFEKVNRQNASLINDIVAAAFTRLDTDPDTLQSTIDEISASNETQLKNFFAAVPVDGNRYEIIAASNPNAVGTLSDAAIFSLVEANDRGVTTQIEYPGGGTATQVVSPIRSSGEIVGFVSVDVTDEVANSVVSEILSRSLFVMMAVVTVIILMLLNHFKFVEYARLFRKLKEVDQLKNDFLSVASHELKAPMAVIKGSIANVLDGVVGEYDDKVKDSLELAFNETDRLAGLVSDLLNVSRIEQGKISYNLERVQPEEIIERIIRQYRPRAKDKGLTLSYKTPEKPMAITVDSGRFLEIMTNLIDNAVKYSRKGEITVVHEIDGDMLKTTVRDTGVGMSAKERENLFRRFYRVRNEKTKDISGTGLGLWIIKQYIEAMDGHIYVDSLEDVGSQFTVEFPLAGSESDEQSTDDDNEEKDKANS